MTNEDVLQLAKQGFTADEIRALGFTVDTTNSAQSPAQGETQTIDQGAGSPNNPPAPDTSENVQTSEIEDTIKSLSETVASLTETVKAMQISNQKNAKKVKGDGPKSADEVVKTFIENM